MRRSLAWSLCALLVGACAIPNIEVDDSVGGTSSDDSGTTNNAGTKSSNGGTKNTTGGTGNGDGGTGNNPSGGTKPTAGTSSGGSGGTAPATGTALAKFCNAVSYQGADTDFELHIGTGDDEVVLTTLTGTCTPVVNKNCVAIPTGDNVEIDVYFPGDTEPYWVGSATISPGEAWIFAWIFDEDTQEAKVVGSSDYTAAECKSTDYDELAGTQTPP